MSMDKDRIFEEQLRQVKPVPIGDHLEERIAARIRESCPENRAFRWVVLFGWGGLLAAASIMVVVGLSLFTPARNSPAGPVAAAPRMESLDVPPHNEDGQAFKPVLAQNNLRGRIDEGIVFLEGGLTARKYRYQFIDRVVWRNPKSGARVELEVPRDEVVLIPVQTY